MRISIIIPALNEESRLPETIGSAESPSTEEVILVDGGSTDSTTSVARGLGATVLISEPGRARQMNRGAAAARGDVLLFLHADTHLPPEFDRHVREVLSAPGTVAGAFQLRIDGSLFSMRLVETAANWRSIHLQMPYGDQAIFLSAREFQAAGGYPDLPIMEDFQLMVRLRRRGRIRIADADATTAARRWEHLGVWRTTLMNQLTIIAFKIGVDPARIARWYHRPFRSI